MSERYFSQIISSRIPSAIPGFVRSFAQHASGSVSLDCFWSELCNAAPVTQIPGLVLERLAARYQVSKPDLDKIPRSGSCVVVSNHPYGLLDAAVLASMLLEVRSDVKFLANPLVASLRGLEQYTIPIDPDGSRWNAAGVRCAIEHLNRGGMIVVFPAGQVSHFSWRTGTVRDEDWPQECGRFLRIAARTSPDLIVVPAFVSGRNSVLFQAVGYVHPALRTALLPRELMNKQRCRLRVRVASPVKARGVLEGRSNIDVATYLRWRCDLLGSDKQRRARTALPLRRNRPARQAIAARGPVEAMEAEMAALPDSCMLERTNCFDVILAEAGQIPAMLLEIGRMREITFREAGEGSGLSRDLDDFDQTYLHLLLWDRQSHCVAGAYRLKATDGSTAALYTSTLFRYSTKFLNELGPAIELGRSFVARQYQKDFTPLLLLWKGIGKFVSRHPERKCLFGPVSISADYKWVSREILTGFLRNFAWADELAHFVSARNPFASRGAVPAQSLDDLSRALSDVEEGKLGVPVLIRHYLKLGGRLLSFNVDSKFSNVVDGLIAVDLLKTDPRLVERYLGKAEAQTFLEYHKASN